MKIVGQRLRALRESVKMSQAKIGALFGCNKTRIMNQIKQLAYLLPFPKGKNFHHL